MAFLIDGVDFTDTIAAGGLKWQRNDIDGPNAGRNKRGNMIRDRIATKMRTDWQCRPLRADRNRQLLQALMPEFVSATYDDPQDGTVNRVMYANNITSEFLMRRRDGTEWWHNTQFPLIER